MNLKAYILPLHSKINTSAILSENSNIYNFKSSIHNLCILKGVDPQDKSPHEVDDWWLALHWSSGLKTSIFQITFMGTSIFQNLLTSKHI